MEKPVAGIRVGWNDETGPILNPDMEEQEYSKLDLIVAGTPDAVIMIEGYSDFLSEEDMMKVSSRCFQEIYCYLIRPTGALYLGTCRNQCGLDK